MSTQGKTVKTSNKDWLKQALKQYAEKKQFEFVDDAELKYTKEDLSSGISLMRAARSKGGVSWQQIVGALASVGIAASGLWIVAAAIADPEPTTKLGLLVGGGLTLILTGSLGILANLGTNFSVSVRSPQGHEFEIKPEFSV